ncbi:MAG: hypothetical protein K2G52_03370 [Muribaculaceae bacterium]|nr:hypothetical protein [Muribaculaceae bacterium]
MVSSLPSRIMNYSVSPSSPTDELMTVGQALSEVGGYASIILDREHLSLSRKCETRLHKVVEELVSRQCILSAENLHDVPDSDLSGTDLEILTIGELHTLYRRWPVRHYDKSAAGRESMSFYFEGRIVREMMRRKAANKSEQLKIDYCNAMYSNELSNISQLFSLPVRVDDDKIYPDSKRSYTPEELSALIRLYKDYRDITEREIFVEYADYSLDWLERNQNVVSGLNLLTEIAEIGRRKIICIPKWVTKRLADTVNLALASKTGRETELSVAMLTLQIINGDSSLERRAQRIINRCYKSTFDDSVNLGERIENLHTAVMCCDYVTRFSVRKAASLWNLLSVQALSSCVGLKSRHIFQLLEIARECEDFARISDKSKSKLRQMLDEMAKADSPESKAYSRIAELKFRDADR